MILVLTYVAVAVAVVAIAGLERAEQFDDDPGILGKIAEDVIGPFAFLVVVAVIISGISSAQTTILPGSRTSLSMAAAGALPRFLAHIHPRFLTPDYGTILVGLLATIWYVGASLVSDNFLFDSLSALSLMIAFYYALTGAACVIYYRRELTRSLKNFLFIGVAPLIGAGLLFYLLFESARELADPKASYTGTEIFGLGVPLVIAIVFTVMGVVLMAAWRFAGGEPSRSFFGREAFEAVPPEIAEGEGKVAAVGVAEEEV